MAVDRQLRGVGAARWNKDKDTLPGQAVLPRPCHSKVTPHSITALTPAGSAHSPYGYDTEATPALWPGYHHLEEV